jgi:heme a synthase
MIFLMVAIGGITRLTDSGLSITEWEVIKGSLPPLTDIAWEEAFEKYKRIPQYEHVNQGMSLQEFKRIYWWEWFHRFWGRLIGLVFFIPFAYFLARKVLRRSFVSHLLIVMLLGGLQGFLGWFMVQSGLEGSDLTSVSHFRLAMHLSLAFLVISYLYWLSLALKSEERNAPARTFPKQRNLWLFCFFLLAVQIVYGAFTAGLDAGHASAHWPKWSDEQWMPGRGAVDFPASFFYNPSWVQFVHRTLAVILVIALAVLIIRAKRLPFHPGLRNANTYLALALIFQFVLGVSTIWLHVPLSLALLHQLGALILLLSMVYYGFHLRGANK